MEITDLHELDPQMAERLTYRGPWAWASKVSDAPSSELCRAWSWLTVSRSRKRVTNWSTLEARSYSWGKGGHGWHFLAPSIFLNGELPPVPHPLPMRAPVAAQRGEGMQTWHKQEDTETPGAGQTPDPILVWAQPLTGRDEANSKKRVPFSGPQGPFPVGATTFSQ